MDFFQIITNYAQETVAAGYLLVMAIICLLQYVYHVHRMRTVRCTHQTEVGLLVNELGEIEKDRSFSTLENHILRAFVEHAQFDKGLKLLLEQFVPHSSEGFAAYFQVDEESTFVRHSIGLSRSSIQNLQLDDDLIESLKQNRLITLTQEEWKASSLAKSMTLLDVKKAIELNLILVGSPDRILGVLLATSLYPKNESHDDQKRLALRLIRNISGNIEKIQDLERQENELWLSNEMLTLRGITDQTNSKPLAMLESFLIHLLEKLNADRAALYLSTTDFTSGNFKPLVRAGRTFQKNIQTRWYEHENRLALTGCQAKRMQSFTKRDLHEIGVDSLMGGAVVMPLFQQERFIGVVCLTRKENREFDALPLKLVNWSGNFLAETILKVISHANIERQARKDGLTNLANRREFDSQLEIAIKDTNIIGTDCSLLLLDLDKFKSVNDVYGHQAGDEVLKQTARIIQEQVINTRSTDRIIVARYGGEEMAVLLPGFTSSGAYRVAESIRTAIEEASFIWEEIEIPVTVSIGIASYPLQAQNADGLIALADSALYQAKECGRNRVCCSETVG